MEWSLGTIMFYGGIVGAIVTVISAIIISIVLKRNRNKIVSAFNNEYGKGLK